VSALAAKFRDGLWRDNPGLVQLLGLCPLLAVTSTFRNGLGLGIATLAVLVLSNALVSATRRWILDEIRIPIYVLIIASLVTCTELVFKAWFPALDRSLGIFIPLIVTNCAIVARAELHASRNSIGSSIIDGLVMGTGFALLLMALGAFRELVSTVWLLALLPPGAFFSLALAIAGKNALDARQRRAEDKDQTAGR
jgi:electron transport complex protein RnfE